MKYKVGDKVMYPLISGKWQKGIITQYDRADIDEPFYITKFDSWDGYWMNPKYLKLGWPNKKLCR